MTPVPTTVRQFDLQPIGATLFIAEAEGQRVGWVRTEWVGDTPRLNPNVRRYVERLGDDLRLPLSPVAVTGSYLDLAWRGTGTGLRLYHAALRDASTRSGALVPHNALAGAGRSIDAARIWEKLHRLPSTVSFHHQDVLVTVETLPIPEINPS